MPSTSSSSSISPKSYKYTTKSEFTQDIINALNEKEENSSKTKTTTTNKNTTQQPQKQQTITNESKKELYNILCHDEPKWIDSSISIPINISFISSFSYTLIDAHFSTTSQTRKEDSKFGLCNRILKGIQFLLAQSSSSSSKNIEEDKTNRCFAELAFSIFIKCPLLILQNLNNDNHETIISVLGSYTATTNTKNETIDNNKGINRLAQGLTASTEIEEEEDNTNDLEELLAEESDDDDYVYESSSNDNKSSTTNNTLFFDPERMFKQQTNHPISSNDILWSILSILQQIEYKMLGLDSITDKRWKDLNISSTLIQLADCLLDDTTYKNSTDDTIKMKLQSLVHSVIFIVIHRSLDERYTSLDLTFPFLLQFLENKIVQKPIPMIVLQCHVHLCNPSTHYSTNKSKIIIQLNSFLFQHFDLLADELEIQRKSLDKQQDAEKEDGDVVDRITFLVSIFHYIVTILQSPTTTSAIKLKCNELQSSGIFREIVLLYITLSSQSITTYYNIIQKMIFASLLDLLSSSSSNDNNQSFILFIVRIPSFITLFTNDYFISNKTMQTTLWSILFLDLNVDPTQQKQQLKLRSTISKKVEENTAPKRNIYEIQTEGVEVLSTRVVSSLQQLTDESKINDFLQEDSIIIKALEEYIQFINCITTVPTLSTRLKQTFEKNKDYYKRTCNEIQDIQTLLNQLSNSKIIQPTTTKEKLSQMIVEDEGDDEMVEKLKRHVHQSFIQVLEKKLTLKNGDNLLQNLRKGVKIFHSFVFLQTSNSSDCLSSKAD